jgi:hypothetical protein
MSQLVFKIENDYSGLLKRHQNLDSELESIQTLVRDGLLTPEEGKRAEAAAMSSFDEFKKGEALNQLFYLWNRSN